MKSENKLKRIWLKINFVVVLSACFVLLPTITSYLYHRNYENLLQMIVITMFGFGFIVFEYYWRNKKNINASGMDVPVKFYYWVVLASGVLVCAFPMMSVLSWPFLVIALLFCLFSDMLQGLLSYSLLLMVACQIKECSVSVFSFYFICGLVVILLFAKMDKSFKIGLPIFISLCVFMLSSVANVVLFMDTTITLEIMLLPIVNIFVSMILMLVVLKTYNYLFYNKFRDKYLTINDTEYVVLIDAKKEEPALYYRAIHTSYLTGKFAVEFGLDEEAIKTASYYWKIIEEKQRKGKSKNFMTENDAFDFPPKAKELVEELMNTKKKYVSKEAIAVYMADTTISSIIDIFKEDKNTRIQYRSFFEKMFKERMDNGFFDRCEFSIGELVRMKKMLIEEALYYDFLR